MSRRGKETWGGVEVIADSSLCSPTYAPHATARTSSPISAALGTVLRPIQHRVFLMR